LILLDFNHRPLGWIAEHNEKIPVAATTISTKSIMKKQHQPLLSKSNSATINLRSGSLT
jgi:hypothetical protein